MVGEREDGGDGDGGIISGDRVVGIVNWKLNKGVDFDDAFLLAVNRGQQ